MTAKERILMIRLMEKAEKHPKCAKALGIEAASANDLRNNDLDPKGLTLL